MQITRENKLALVVGFALILFVGILISDHFSTARNQASANLAEHRPNDPLVASRRSDGRLLDYRSGTPPGLRGPGSPTGTPAVNSAAVPTVQERPAVSPRPEPERIEMGSTNAGADRAESNNPPVIFHQVRAGETLASISRRHYGDESLARELARFNDLKDPNTLRVDQRLRIPDAAALTGRAQQPLATAPAQPRQEPKTKSYTVQSGDTLSEISQRQLGTTRRWREIYEMNKDVIPDPDRLQVGTVLRLPAN